LGHLRNGEFGRCTTLKEITVVENNKRKNTNVPKTKTRVIRINEDLYLHFVDFSRRYYDVESYSEILEKLLKDFESHNQDKSWRDMNES
jgi:hypothetical protein